MKAIHRLAAAGSTITITRLPGESWGVTTLTARDYGCGWPRFFESAAAAAQHVRESVRSLRRDAGRWATESLWARLCDGQAAEARGMRAAVDLLRSQEGRREVLSLAGRRYSAGTDYLATRQVVADAAAILAARAQRRSDRAISEAARVGKPGRILALIPLYRELRVVARRKATLARLRSGRIGRAALDAVLPSLLEQVSHEADAAVRAVVGCVGEIGEQARADLEQMQTSENFTGKKGRHHKLERTTLCRVEHLTDWSAALLTLRSYSSFGSGNGGEYSSRGGSNFRCYLVVRDSSNGTAHILRVPPRFGNSDTQFYAGFRSSRERLQAAVAWTFDVPAEQYRPALQA